MLEYAQLNRWNKYRGKVHDTNETAIGGNTLLYLSQCRPRSISPYGVTRPQWVKF